MHDSFIFAKYITLSVPLCIEIFESFSKGSIFYWVRVPYRHKSAETNRAILDIVEKVAVILASLATTLKIIHEWNKE